MKEIQFPAGRPENPQFTCNIHLGAFKTCHLNQMQRKSSKHVYDVNLNLGSLGFIYVSQALPEIRCVDECFSRNSA